MNDVVVEQTKVVALSCYKAVKFKGTPDAACPFGFEEIRDTCRNCHWLSSSRVVVLGRQLAHDEKIADMPLGKGAVVNSAAVVAKLSKPFQELLRDAAPAPTPHDLAGDVLDEPIREE